MYQQTGCPGTGVAIGMFGRSRQISQKTGKKRRFLPIVSIVLAICYIGVVVWYFTRGFGDGGAVPDNADYGSLSSSAPDSDAEAPDPYPPDTDEQIPPGDENTADSNEAAAAASKAIKVRGLYIAAWYAGMSDRMNHYIEICDSTEINTLVIDIKDDEGQITFVTDSSGISPACVNIIPDIREVMTTLKEHGIYTIARIVCFKDPFWSSAHPELAIHNENGDLWKDNNGSTWLDPYRTGAWEYLTDVSMEAARIGFDEVQLDYVRFPTDGKISAIDYGSAGTRKSKTEAISDFADHVRAALADAGVKLSADVFAIIAISDLDAESIGQDPKLLLNSTDYLSPMVYPSHFSNKNQNGIGQIINDVLYEAPDLEPYGVVYNILHEFNRRLTPGSGEAGIRPYLQDFTASYLGSGFYQSYTAAQVLEQIQAVYDAGFEEWILWNQFSSFSEEAFQKN